MRTDPFRNLRTSIHDQGKLVYLMLVGRNLSGINRWCSSAHILYAGTPSQIMTPMPFVSLRLTDVDCT